MGYDSILKENEINANHMTAMILNVTAVVVVITWILFETELFYARVGVRGLMITNLFLMFVVSLVCKRVQYEKPWVKYALMGTLTVVYAGTTAILTYNVVLLVVIPIVLSIRYFSKQYTRAMAGLSLVVFFLAYLYGANHGMLDMNFVQYPVGTTIVTNENMWLDDAVAGIDYDTVLMIKNTIFSNYFVKFLQMVIIVAASVKLVDHCQEIMQKQKELTQNSARIGAELSLATKIQADVLPSLFPAFPQRKEFDLFASMNPAKEVGGDFYDFFMVDDDHLALVIADVSGKGVPAAMFMMASKNIIATNAMLGNSPAETLRKANDSVCANNSEDMFVTVWIGIITISTGLMVCSSAGHEYPVLKHDSDRFELLKDKHGMPVGFIDGSEYEEYEIQFEPGDKLFVYTDGVPEATRVDKEMYGTDRIVSALNRDTDASCEQMITNIWEDVAGFIGDAEQFDDLTMLSFEYRGE